MNRLWITFRYTFAHLRGQVLGWGLGLAIYGLMLVPMYDKLQGEQGRLQQLIAGYPPEFLAFFGGDATSLIAPAGFLGMFAFSMMPIIIGIFAVIAGSGLIVNDEERGRLDLIMAHPVGRSAFFFGRLLASVAAVIAIMLLGWLGFSLLLGGSSLGFNWGEMAVPFISLAAQVLLYTALGLALSLLMPSRSLAAMVTGAVMAGGYFVSSLAFMDERLAQLAKITPYHYFQTALSFDALKLDWLLALLVATVVLILIAWLRFAARDIRLSGEGNWRLLLPRRKPTA